jgi:predicted MFS family arabinose efflux permease
VFVQPEKEGSIALNTFRALRYRYFRLLWIGLAVSAVGTWMQIVALSLLVLKITHGSAFALGTVSLAQALSFFLFALVGGSVADRFDKRRLLLFTQCTSAGLAILLGVLTWAGVIEFWMILVISFLNGTVLSFDQPARGALVSGLVAKEDLMNAISLQSTVFNGAAAAGPALAGFGVGLLGYAGNFFLNGASFIGVLIALYVMRAPAQSANRQSTLTAVRESLGTVRGDTVLLWVLAGYGALLCFGPSPALILPVYAVKVLHVGPERLGLLFSSVGLGSILGALIVASLGSGARKGCIYLIGILIWVGALTSFALSGGLWLSMAALLVLGVGQTFTATTAITLLQIRVPEQMRGRIMSLNTLLIMGIRPLGDFPAGALISMIGAPATLLLSAGLVGTYGTVASLLRPSIRSA